MNEIQNHRAYLEKLHPSTLAGLAPLFTWQGRDVYPVFGADGEDEGTGEPNSDSDDQDDDDTGDGDDQGGSETVTREEFEKLRKQLSASDKNKSAAEKKLKEIEDAKKDELTKATERAETAEKALEKSNQELGKLRLQNAFLGANTGITWHDPEDALDIAERRGYLDEVVDDSGKVDAGKLKAKLLELAKAKPNLVKNADEAGKDKGKGKEETKPPTGKQVGSKGNNGGGKDEAIPARYSKYLV